MIQSPHRQVILSFLIVGLLIMASLSFASSSGHGEVHESHPSTKKTVHIENIHEIPKDRPIPANLFQSWFSPTTVIAYASIEVQMTEITAGVLKYPEILIRYPKGGGSLDLNQFVTSSTPGLFKIRIFFSDDSCTKMAFVSKTKKRKIEDNSIGLGCNQWVSFSARGLKDLTEKGITVSTENLFHITVLGGQYILHRMLDETALLAQLMIFDSKYTPLFCEGSWN